MDPMPSTAGPLSHMAQVIREDLRALHANWYWFVILGIVLVALGAAAVSYACIATVVATEVWGVFMLIGGIIFLGTAVFTRGWGGFFLSLLAGVLHLACGFILVNHPAQMAVVLTLVLAIFFFTEGLFRIIGALSGRFQNWEWVLLSGILTTLLGVLIWKQWPYSGLWVIGTFIGIDLIFSGISYVTLGLRAKRLTFGTA